MSTKKRNPKFTDDEEDELIAYENGDFEQFCGSCMFFEDPENCPHYGKVLDLTEWRKICNKFYD